MEQSGKHAYSPAQELYAQARMAVRRVDVDAELMQFLKYGMVLADIDGYSEEQLEVLEFILSRCQSGEINEVRLACGAGNAVHIRRKLRCLGLTEPLVFQKRFNRRFCSALRQGIQCDSFLTRLELYGIRIDPEAAKELGKGLLKNKTICFFSISGSECGDAAFGGLAPGLAGSTSIQDLVLSGCALTDRSARDICRVLGSHSQRRSEQRWGHSLRRMDRNFEDNPLHIEDLNKISLMGVLAVDLSENYLEDIFASAIARSLVADDWLGAINLRNNRITSTGVNAIYITADQSNDALACVDMSGNLSNDDESVRKLDELFRIRSTSLDRGILARTVPNLDASNNARGANELVTEPLLSRPNPAAVIAAAIIRWQSGHQLSSEITDVIASLAQWNRAEDKFPTPSVPKGESISIPRIAFSDDQATTWQSFETPPAQTSGAGANTTTEPEWGSAILEVSDTQDRVEDSAMEQMGPVNDNKEVPPFAQTETRTTSKKSATKKHRKKKKKQSKKKSKETRIALAFADEINKAIRSYAAQLDNPEVAEILLEKCTGVAGSEQALPKAATDSSSKDENESLEILERSVEQLNACIDRMGAPATPIGQSHNSIGDADIVEDITDKVADRLAKMRGADMSLKIN
uniref:Uncharacterized protein n=1 Tax=Mucochytrium quahogii TaxID=96639 RepID=A0A7S2RF10_9STRA|mmetsp:Transcript_14109/g.30540  ORF Transcript_14109/g.30540 Transcript_14109/m.30540 type:complete len:636 (+) Transcript_14109:276-2183(+)